MNLDHIVYGVPDLKQAIELFKKQSGVEPVIAGKHPGLGTHNAILSLGNMQYLEFIALDPEAPKKNKELPSLCSSLLDLSAAKIMTWVIRTDNLAKVVNELNALGNFQIDPPQSFSRTKSDGTVVAMELAYKKLPPAPGDGLIPFFINWGKTPHPSLSVACKCQIKEWYGCHPNADMLNNALHKVGIDFLIKPAEVPSMHLVMNTPKGEIEIH